MTNISRTVEDNNLICQRKSGPQRTAHHSREISHFVPNYLRRLNNEEIMLLQQNVYLIQDATQKCKSTAQKCFSYLKRKKKNLNKK